jgi:hypothetical protein
MNALRPWTFPMPGFANPKGELMAARMLADVSAKDY